MATAKEKIKTAVMTTTTMLITVPLLSAKIAEVEAAAATKSTSAAARQVLTKPKIKAETAPKAKRALDFKNLIMFFTSLSSQNLSHILLRLFIK
jgi:hypothetical protein